MLHLTTQDRGFLAVLKISPESPQTRERLEAQVSWLYAINSELCAEAAELRREIERRDHREKLHNNSRACLFALLLVSLALNLRTVMEWAASFRLP